MTGKKGQSGGVFKEVDLRLLEDAISDPSLTLAQAAKKAGINRNTIYTRSERQPEFAAMVKRAMRRRKESNPVWLRVKAAIADGCSTRYKICKRTGMKYGQVDVVLARMGEYVMSDEVNGVEHFTLADES